MTLVNVSHIHKLPNQPLPEVIKPMNFRFAAIHARLFSLLLLAVLATVSLSLHLGELTDPAQVDWIDAFGEGGITLMTLIWIGFTVISRPAGRVTNLLFAGLTVMHVSMLLDFLDEFVHYPQDSAWLTTIESLPAPIGMIMMTFALYHWHREQMAINATLAKKERFYREHSQADYITGLYNAEYMKQQISHEAASMGPGRTFSLLMIDTVRFDDFNREYGHARGDALLKTLAGALELNLRPSDLLCRYAGDRFVVLLPNTNGQQADKMAQKLRSAITHQAHHPDDSSQAVYHDIHTAGLEYRQGLDAVTLLCELDERIETAQAQSE